MTIFCIQIQPDRAPDLNLDRTKELCKLMAEDRSLISRHGVIEGNDEGPYLNLMFEAENASKFWTTFDKTIYGDPVVGEAMKRASMATCTGEDGWEDYLLLHHFDPQFELDTLP